MLKKRESIGLLLFAALIESPLYLFVGFYTYMEGLPALLFNDSWEGATGYGLIWVLTFFAAAILHLTSIIFVTKNKPKHAFYAWMASLIILVIGFALTSSAEGKMPTVVL